MADARPSSPESKPTPVPESPSSDPSKESSDAIKGLEYKDLRPPLFGVAPGMKSPASEPKSAPQTGKEMPSQFATGAKEAVEGTKDSNK